MLNDNIRKYTDAMVACYVDRVSLKELYSKQPNLWLTQEFGPTAFSVASERHRQSGLNEIAQAS